MLIFLIRFLKYKLGIHYKSSIIIDKFITSLYKMKVDYFTQNLYFSQYSHYFLKKSLYFLEKI
jgi:hypothetical protein